MSSPDPHGQEYLRAKKVQELFQSLTVGLLYNQPEDHVTYLLHCLDKVRILGPDKVLWDTFLPDHAPGARSWQRGVPLPSLQRQNSKEPNSKQTNFHTKPTNEKQSHQDAHGSSVSSATAASPSDREPSTAISEKTKQKLSLDDVDRIMKGSLDNLPPMPTNTVRIFLSSTFSDFRAERNILPKEAYPQLQQFCSDHGLDFQVVDMRWGVTDEAINDHSTSLLCIREISICQQISCGPNFVTLLGNRYGYQPFPAQIPCMEYEILMEITSEMKLPDHDLLSEWFTRDDNALPPLYVLQPIKSKLKHYNDSDPQHADLRSQDRKLWDEIFARLREVLRTAATEAHHRGQLTSKQLESYFTSVTEHEVTKGIMVAQDVTDKALCYVRELKGIEKCTTDDVAHRFIDMKEDNTLDEISQQQRTDLVQEKVPRKLRENQIHQYETDWKGMPLELSDEEEHTKYLHKFAEDFVTDMKTLIQRSQEDRNTAIGKKIEDLYYEVLHHLHFCVTKCETFCGREDVLAKVEKYLTDGSEQHPPLILHGKSGYGKTSVLAFIAQSVPRWIESQCAVVLRFLGTSPASSTIISVLLSIIRQVCAIYKFDDLVLEDLQTVGDARRCLWALFTRVSEDHPHQSLVLILDSVDQLVDLYGAHQMLWMPKTLQSNIFIIISMLSDRYTCLKNTQKRILNSEAYVALGALPETTGNEIIRVFLEKHERCLTYSQHQLIFTAFNNCRQPLFLKLLLDQAKLWHSYTIVDQVTIATSVQAAITHLFEKTEEKFGKLLVSSALGYLTCGKDGLTGIEMEDVLSCDDDVLNDVYQYHDPPLEGIIRIPSLLWARVQYEVSEYITERQADGKNVMAWYHRQFSEAAESRYLLPQTRKEQLFQTLAELFLKEAGIKKTIILKKRRGKIIENADRQVTPQPLNPRNLRKLNALPYYLLHAGQRQTLKQRCHVNFGWLLTKLRAVSVASVLSEYTAILASEQLKGDAETVLIKDFIQLAYESLRHDPYQLAYQVLERLKPMRKKSDLISVMIRDAERWVRETSVPLLLPTHPINLQTPDSPLRFTLLAGYDGILTPDEETVICNWSEKNAKVAKVQIWNLSSKDFISSIETSNSSIFQITPAGDLLVVADAEIMKICDTESGDIVSEFQYRTEKFDKIDVRAIAVSQEASFVAVGIKFGKLKKAKAWKYTSFIFLVDVEAKALKEELDFTPNTGDRHIDKLLVSSDGNHLIALSFDKITIMGLKTLSILKTVTDLKDIKAETFQLYQHSNLLIGGFGGQFAGHGQIAVYKLDTHQLKTSDSVHIGEDKGRPVAVVTNQDFSRMATATCEDGKKRNNSLCLWDTTTDTYTKIQLGIHDNKFPRNLAMVANWTLAVIGWEGGDISLVHVPSQREVVTFKGHDRGVTFMRAINLEQEVLTMGWDFGVKVWAVNRLISQMESAQVTSQSVESNNPYLDESEQCVTMATTNKMVITAPPGPGQGPKCWNIENAQLNYTITNRIHKRYQEIYKDKTNIPPRLAADMSLLKNCTTLFDNRKTRNSSFIQISDIQSATVLLDKWCDTAYRALVSKHEEIVLVHEGQVEIYNPLDWSLIKTMPAPAVDPEIARSPPKGLLTSDDHYLILLISLPSHKYFDLIDLETGSHVGRTQLPETASLSICEDMTYLLVFNIKGEAKICTPSQLMYLKEEITYNCAISGSGFTSPEHGLGIEINADYSMSLWELNPPNQRYLLTGHEYQVKTVAFSSCGQFLASGAFDKTVRVWCVGSGEQLCMFDAGGAVDTVLFTPDTKHLVIHCYVAPKRKRVIILKLYNTKS